MNQKPTLFASSLQLFASGDPMANLKKPESKGPAEDAPEFDLNINSKLPEDLRKALQLDAEDKEWKPVEKLDDLKEETELDERSPDAKKRKEHRRSLEKMGVYPWQSHKNAPPPSTPDSPQDTQHWMKHDLPAHLLPKFKEKLRKQIATKRAALGMAPVKEETELDEGGKENKEKKNAWVAKHGSLSVSLGSTKSPIRAGRDSNPPRREPMRGKYLTLQKWKTSKEPGEAGEDARRNAQRSIHYIKARHGR
jgi:hypothetical protein